MRTPDPSHRLAHDSLAPCAVLASCAVGRARFLPILAALLCLPSVARARIDLSAPPPKDPAWAGPSLSLGRVGLDPCPGGYCRPDPNGNLFYFMTPHTRPIEPVPGVILRIPFGGGDP